MVSQGIKLNKSANPLDASPKEPKKIAKKAKKSNRTARRYGTFWLQKTIGTESRILNRRSQFNDVIASVFKSARRDHDVNAIIELADTEIMPETFSR